jgi:cytochrome P450
VSLMTDVDDLKELVRVDDPEFYDTANAPLLARLRNEAPVFYYEELNTWVLSKYQDVKFASKTPELYSVRKGILLNDARYGESIADSFFADGAELISTLDPPRHGQVRRTLAPAFTPRAIGRLEDAIRTVCREIIGGFSAGASLDFVNEAARVIPIQAVAQLLGVPRDEVDVDKIQFWTDEMLKMGAPLSREELEQAAANTADMGTFLMELFTRKRANPGGDDLMTTLAAAELDNERLSEANILMLSIATLVAGNETTRNLLSGCMWALAEHPDQMQLLAADPGLIKQTVEEVLRWVTPVPGFMRNATQDIELRGQSIKQGQYVYLLYFAANRDEESWANPDSFDITRPADPSVLSFGFGQHACIGAALARLEARVFLEELLSKFNTVSLAGTAERVPSPLQHGWSHLPVVFGGRGA